MSEHFFLKTRKKLGILIVCFLILGTIPLAFCKDEGIDNINVTKIYDNPDNNWIEKCLNDSTKVSRDIKSVLVPIKNNDLEGLSKCADKITADSQAAIDTSNSYKVSSDLQPIKDEYNLGMEQAGQFAIIMYKLVEDAKNGTDEDVKSDWNKAAEPIRSYNQHINSVNNQLLIFITERHITNMRIINNMDPNHVYIYYP